MYIYSNNFQKKKDNQIRKQKRNFKKNTKLIRDLNYFIEESLKYLNKKKKSSLLYRFIR